MGNILQNSFIYFSMVDIREHTSEYLYPSQLFLHTSLLFLSNCNNSHNLFTHTNIKPKCLILLNKKACKDKVGLDGLNQSATLSAVPSGTLCLYSGVTQIWTSYCTHSCWNKETSCNRRESQGHGHGQPLSLIHMELLFSLLTHHYDQEDIIHIHKCSCKKAPEGIIQTLWSVCRINALPVVLTNHLFWYDCWRCLWSLAPRS